MPEKETRPVDSASENPLTRPQKVARQTSLIAYSHDLDRMTYEALSKYAYLILRIRRIKTDFEGTTIKGTIYQTHEAGDEERNIKTITREDYRENIQIVSKIAFNLYNTYLSHDPYSRAAAREVQVVVDDLYPQNP